MKCFICLFGDEVRLYYFIVLHPACSASRCWHVMTVLAKQRSPLALCCLRSRLPSPPSGLLRGRKPGWSQIIIQYSRNNSMIFPIPGGKKIGSHYLPRYTRYRVIAGRVIKGGHCTNKLRSRQRRGTREIIALFILRMVCCQSCLVLFALKLRLLTSKLEVGSQLPNRAHISRASCLKNPGERK